MSQRQRAAYFTYRGLSAALQVFPDRVAWLIATASGRLMWHVSRGKRPLLRRTFGRVLGPAASPATVERCIRAAFHSYAHYWVDSARLGAMPSDRLMAGWAAEGIEHVWNAQARGKGVVLVLPHVGSWEYAGRVMAELGLPMAAVAEVLEPPELFHWFVAQREQLGISIIPLQPGSGGDLLRALGAGKVLCLLADRDLSGNGITLDFFGEETTLPSGPATLALRTGAALMTCAVYHFPGRKHFAVINPEIDCTRKGSLRADVARLTGEVARQVEDLIRRAPEQWHMFQPDWPADREAADA